MSIPSSEGVLLNRLMWGGQVMQKGDIDMKEVREVREVRKATVN